MARLTEAVRLAGRVHNALKNVLHLVHLALIDRADNAQYDAGLLEPPLLDHVQRDIVQRGLIWLNEHELGVLRRVVQREVDRAMVDEESFRSRRAHRIRGGSGRDRREPGHGLEISGHYLYREYETLYREGQTALFIVEEAQNPQ